MLNKQKSLTTAIIGRTNVGKSSLLNKIIGQKISIVTPKVQTTRSLITGIYTSGDTQIILLDTPGIFAQPKTGLEKAMLKCAWSTFSSADIVSIIIDASRPLDNFSIDMLKMLGEKTDQKILFVLNKIDVAKRSVKYEVRGYLRQQFAKAGIFEVSALVGTGVDEYLDYLKELATISPWGYSEDEVTTLPMRFLSAEITREKLFLNLSEELPYQLSVYTEQWKDNPDKSVTIHQVITVARENYKKIILGKSGAKIKEIGKQSRLELEKEFGHRVHLFLFIRVRTDWDREDHNLIKLT